MSSAYVGSGISPLANQVLKPGVKWLPFQREQTTGVVQRSGIDESERPKLIRSGAEILGSGMDPKKGPSKATGLVVGYVQSGKTLSFTTVIGLARDNGFPLVIVVAGTKTNLLTQSHQRLLKDLDVEGGEGLPAWIMDKNPKEQGGRYEQLLKQTIANWRDVTRDAEEKPTLLLTVLKQNQRLSALTALLRKLDMKDVPALVIDDEADQASLNVKVNKGEESTTYTRLRELRDALPCHTFLQYTATPQAPLLINISDVLSPGFVHVLEPGTGYVGGAEFFKTGSPYVKVISAADIPANNALPVDPPDIFLEAMRAFFVGLAASIIGKTGRRSMLVHPAVAKLVHQANVRWATAAKDAWVGALGGPIHDPDRKDVLTEFKRAYDELAKTEAALPAFDAIVEKLPRALRNTTVIEFNTRGSPKTPEINWRHAEGWILVGGQAVDRGFTVDSLSVTYMPRGVGVGNADTIQQRARFFGYKRKYLGLCRVYVSQDLKAAFEDYVEHEQTMRTELTRLAASGEDLRSWRRRLILDPSLQPCRRSVISDPYTRARAGGGWTQQRGALLTIAARQANAQVVAKLVSGLSFRADKSYVSNEVAQQHEIASAAPMQSIIDALMDYRFEDPRDTAAFTGLLVTIAEAYRNDSALTAAVYKMRPKASGRRDIKNDGTIENFLQGRTDRAGGYPGDTSFQQPDKLTLQLHTYDLRQKNKIVADAAP
ncbi:MAG TPA: Z1 domain-containing protein, partial [Pyrinomonadaceae bacterium]|nr:Z1 domain-containing protein [Pyrinomonadaceae bacterium]